MMLPFARGAGGGSDQFMSGPHRELRGTAVSSALLKAMKASSKQGSYLIASPKRITKVVTGGTGGLSV